jgi:DNA polymerase-1
MSKQNQQRLLSGFEEAAESESIAASEKVIASPPSSASSAPDLQDRTVWVVDAHALIYQVFHAMPDMSGPAGQPIGAVHGFIRDITDLIEKKSPDYLICAFDHSDITFRHSIFDGYKVNRKPMPDDLRPQIEGIARMLDAMRVPRMAAPGYEADDLLATIARQVHEAGGRCVLVTNDKDCWQLIGDHVSLYNIRKNVMLDEQALQREWGVRPDQVVDFQALVGDSVDDVPGVPLIGPKIARELLEKYDTLERVLEHANEVSGTKRRENLIQFREQALISKQLVRLADDVPLEVDWSGARVGKGFDGLRLQELCSEFGFRQLGQRLFQLADVSIAAVWTSEYTAVRDENTFSLMLEQLRQEKRFALNLETTSTLPRFAKLIGLSFACCEGKGWYVPLQAPQGEQRLDLELVMRQLTPLLEDPLIEKIGQNLKFAAIVLRDYGVSLRGAAFDTMVADYLLAPGERTHELTDLAHRYLQRDMVTISQLVGSGRGQRSLDAIAVDEMTRFAGENADAPLRLASLLPKRLQASELTTLFEQLELPLIEVLAEMEYQGIRIDALRLRDLGERFEQRLSAMQAEIFEHAGQPFNVESPKQLGEVLYERLKLPVLKRTRTSGPSTDADVLEELAALHPLPAKIVAYRQIAKLKGTYVDALPQLIHPQTGRIHTSFKQDVAATGRLSSQDPNLQNIPIRTQEGREIRSAFLPAEGWQLLKADYSQIELRILAHFSGDEALLGAFQQDEDIHARVASEVFGVPAQQIQAEMRRRAKAVNFGIIYGQTAFGLAKGLNISKEDASQFIDAYFARYPGVRAFMEKTLDACREKGYVSTILGRRRAVEGVRHSSRRGDGRFRTLPERIAINTVIQGSAADLIKQAMINVHRRLVEERLQARMLLQIHDELVFEVPSSELAHLANLVESEMTGAARLDTPLKVDVKSGANWAECEDVHIARTIPSEE